MTVTPPRARRRSSAPAFAVLLLLASAIGPAAGPQTASLKLTWNPVSDSNVTGYRVYLGPEGSLTLFQEVSKSTTSLHVTGLRPDTKYCVEISALHGSCESERSATACALAANTGPTIVPLSPPEGDSCVDRDGSLQVQIQDPDHSIDLSSIVVLLNGVAVNPSISGSGSSVTLTMPVPTDPPSDGVLEVKVVASDLGSPPGTTTYLYTVRLKPPAPTGLHIP